MSRKLAFATNPLEPAKVTQTIELASNLRSLFDRGGSSSIRKQSTIRIEWLRANPDQPRKHFDPEAMEELKASIQAYGILEPIVVRLKDDNYEILCGERRFRAARELGLIEVPVVVREATDHEALLLSIQENIQRNDLIPLEEARAYKQLLDKGVTSSQRELATLLGVSQSRISKKLSLLDLPDDLQAQMIPRESPTSPSASSDSPGITPRRTLSERHLHAIRKLTHPSGRKLLTDQVIAQGLTVQQTEELVEQVLVNQGAEDFYSSDASAPAHSGDHQESDSPGITRPTHWTVGPAQLRETSFGLIIRLKTKDRAKQITQLKQILASLTTEEPSL